MLYIGNDGDGSFLHFVNEKYVLVGDLVYEIIDGYNHIELYEFIKNYELNENN
ncbi:hypothetical protein [Helicovermis profundi]|uniref:Uncharacterized protein n=1 Tax=Helicovermis profundi TaxID=3065157 RepID=A0AAU9ECD3_9FIRM|nr:hypothetical protein HLPR_05630 [Clostridia bacterium S502]